MKKVVKKFCCCLVVCFSMFFASPSQAALSDWNDDFNGPLLSSGWGSENGAVADFNYAPGWCRIVDTQPSLPDGDMRMYRIIPDLAGSGEWDVTVRFKPSGTVNAAQGIWHVIDADAGKNLKVLYYCNQPKGSSTSGDGLAVMDETGTLLATVPGASGDLVILFEKRNSTQAEIADNGRTYISYALPGDTAWTYLCMKIGTNTASGATATMDMIIHGKSWYGDPNAYDFYGVASPRYDFFHFAPAAIYPQQQPIPPALITDYSDFFNAPPLESDWTPAWGAVVDLATSPGYAKIVDSDSGEWRCYRWGNSLAGTREWDLVVRFIPSPTLNNSQGIWISDIAGKYVKFVYYRNSTSDPNYPQGYYEGITALSSGNKIMVGTDGNSTNFVSVVVPRQETLLIVQKRNTTAAEQADSGRMYFSFAHVSDLQWTYLGYQKYANFYNASGTAIDMWGQNYSTGGSSATPQYDYFDFEEKGKGCGKLNIPGDLNVDCRVDFNDVRILADQWLGPYTFADYAVLAAKWLDCFDPVSCQ